MISFEIIYNFVKSVLFVKKREIVLNKMYEYLARIYIICLLICTSSSVYDYYEGDFEDEQDYNEIATTTIPTGSLSTEESKGSVNNFFRSLII